MNALNHLILNKYQSFLEKKIPILWENVTTKIINIKIISIIKVHSQ